MLGFSRWSSRARERPAIWVGLSVTIVAFFTYFYGYWNPPYFFWDENYHVASAQKYLHGIYFMEPHPPLGKLLIALGERLVTPESNAASDQFLDTSYGTDLPPNFSFAGFRLVPALMGWLSAPLLFSCFLLITRSALLAGLVTVPYVFDNALIVHSRGAMLEPVLVFFVLWMVLLFLLLIRGPTEGKRSRWLSLALGACLAAVLTTKVIGLIMIGLYIPLLWTFARNSGVRGALRDLALPSFIGFAIVFVAVWQAHFSLAATVNPTLENDGYFRASDAYRLALDDHTTTSIGNFGTMLRDSLAFLPHYAEGVPRLDLCKSDENGSPWFLWPVGARAINYRWETPGGGEDAPYRYLYLQSNPVVWGMGLLGVFLAATMLLASLVLPLHRPLQEPLLLAVFLGLWIAYLIAVSRIDRVMYLYHYFLPLLFSLLLVGIAVTEIRRIGRWAIHSRGRSIALTLCAVAVVGSFFFYRPLTYYEPITDEAFMKRSILRIWDLHCVRCERTSPLVAPHQAAEPCNEENPGKEVGDQPGRQWAPRNGDRPLGRGSDAVFGKVDLSKLAERNTPCARTVLRTAEQELLQASLAPLPTSVEAGPGAIQQGIRCRLREDPSYDRQQLAPPRESGSLARSVLVGCRSGLRA
jgi:dolichyl-phosphate-mannose--protein O-mannosyl transferase